MSQPQISPEDILVRSQPTPNPYAIKFIVNQAIKREGKATFHTREEAESVPLAQTFFNVLGVKQVYFFENTITVTHDGSLDADEVESQIESIVKTRLPIHNPDFDFHDQSPHGNKLVDRESLSPELQKIEEILDRTIRPGLQADGGDVEVLRLENNELEILYQGACGGCPSAMMGTLDAIQNILRHELDNHELIVMPV